MIGITALVPPEVVYASGNEPSDLNNYVPTSKLTPVDKLCAWTAIWRDLVLSKKIEVDKLVVVAGGDCYNAIVDGEKIELSGIPTHYFMYPFDRSKELMKGQVNSLADFLGGIKDRTKFRVIKELKRLALKLDRRRIEGKIPAEDAFSIQVTGSDLQGDLEKYKASMEKIEEREVEFNHRVAILGIPPIYPDFHNLLQSLGLHVVYDEMPYEFIRLSGASIAEVSRNYVNYTFAGNIRDRIAFVEKELKTRGVDGIIHFQQFSCHHKLEDPILRKYFNRELGYPYMTIEADLPSTTPEQVRLRLEAFAERLVER
jgi:hypothetical protein